MKQTHRILMWLGVVVVLVLAVWGLSKTGSQTGGELSVPVTSADWIRGDISSKIVVVEYGDFQCPACGTYHKILKQLEQEFADRMAFVYRHYPLEQIHPHALNAAKAAEAAGRQGKFWEMHDLLFDNQTVWAQLKPDQALDIFKEYAKTLKLDAAQFENDMNSDETAQLITEDVASGNRSGITGTPTFFINGEKLASNPQGTAPFRDLLNETLNSDIITTSTPSASP